MTKANGHCNRCSGKGFRDTPVAHLGVPGLCYGCNGDGTYETFARLRAEAKIAKAVVAKQQEPLTKIWEVRLANPQVKGLDREARIWARWAGVFSTEEFAAAHLMTKADAWIALCVSYPKVGPAYDAAGEVLGWESYT